MRRLISGDRPTEPVPGNADTEEDTIDSIDSSIESFKDLKYSYRVPSILRNAKNSEDMVYLLKSLGSEVPRHSGMCSL